MSQFDLVMQQIVNGLVLGSVYVLIAVGFTLCLGVLKMINIAQGHFLMLGAFMTYQAAAWWFKGPMNGWQYAIAIVISVSIVSFAGLVVHYVGVWPVQRRGEIAPILTTVALAFMIENIAIIAWPGSGRNIETVLSDNARNPFGQVHVTDQRIMTFVAAICLMALLYIFLQRTRVGKALRATTQNQMSASLMGINPEFMRAMAMVLSAFLAAAGGAFIGPLFTITPNMGLSYLFKAMIVVLIGGMGNVPGALVGGLILGLMESLIGGLWSAAWVNVATFGIIIVILIVRPKGLLGSKGI
jgi:branched-subunit amino acid ABC-type transport system permease component